VQEVEYRPYYKYYAKVTKAYKPRTNEDVRLFAPSSPLISSCLPACRLTGVTTQLELVEGEMIVITGTAKGTLFMGESRVRGLT
jgi:hypothetical protein